MHTSAEQKCAETFSTYASFVIVTWVLRHLTIITMAADSVNHVTCGSVIKLANDLKTRVRLHSHDSKYGSGSGQQSVTVAENQDTNRYFVFISGFEFRRLLRYTAR